MFGDGFEEPGAAGHLQVEGGLAEGGGLEDEPDKDAIAGRGLGEAASGVELEPAR